MLKIPLETLKEKILASGKITPRDFDERIKLKINELSGLISEEGAAYIIANELGVQIINLEQQRLKIKEIYSGMRNVTTVGKVMRKFEVKEFTKQDKTGKVCSIIIGDESGSIRAVFWNDQVTLAQKLQEDDVVMIQGAYVRENNGNKEIHLGDRSEITINPEGEHIGVVRKSVQWERRKIDALKDGDAGVEVVGTIVQVFDPRFFLVCPTCAKRLFDEQGGHKCMEHGMVQPALSYVLNLVVDDGSSTIRSIFWKNQVQHLLGMSDQDIAKYKENPMPFEDVKTNLLGEQLKIVGKVKKNEMFNRFEFNVQFVEKASPEEEIARLEKTSG